MNNAIYDDVLHLAEKAKDASAVVARTTIDERNGALSCMARALRDNTSSILQANSLDMKAAEAAGTSDAILDRLMLDEARVNSMADALEDLVKLADPLSRTLEARDMYNGMYLERVSVAMGVVGIIYEARPNVTADAAGICIKSGNSCILRGGSLAAHSNEAITNVLASAAMRAGMPCGCISAITTTDRSATDALMQLHGIVDLIIPRGGAGLIRHCVENSKVPVIETGTGNCHVYIHESADVDMAKQIVLNAKCRRYGVCNAAETLLVDSTFDASGLARIMDALVEKGVLLHCDEKAMNIAKSAGIKTSGNNSQAVLATQADWETEYLAPEIAVKIIDGGVEEAQAHINKYGTGHSEAIVATDDSAIELFLSGVDAAAVYANASTAFTDGGQFGLGAEIGISTQKLHVRGPFALEALTSYKYILRGNGQVRA
ncbi:glutamate-5-semialdehyde dehydrogenase [Adlercreutzia sp. ZJ304]|uniref:glutamate-5-semialdehyde dehydrogenase n=1 Tax=Adlercreutzia sp. ZJ304 TaxID=2709791 RepID=UPI0013E9D8BC|nr:glutamate-5-semialdehyde dehydrogenase [Adlercreutzia sp. ZJ304]